MQKRVLLPIVIILIAVAILFALVQFGPEKPTIEKPEKVWRVNTVSVTFQQLSPEITIYGRIETPREATLKAALVADIVTTDVLEGSEVDKDQLLLILDDTDVILLIDQRQADVAENQALISSEKERFQRDQSLLEQETQLLQLADKAVARAKKLEKSRLTSQSSLDDAIAAKQRQLVTLKRLKHDIAEHPARLAQLQARKQRAQALLSQAQVDLERSKIKAPFAGRIAKLYVTVGDRVRTGDELLTIYDLENLEVRAQLPGRYIKQIRTMMASGEQLTAEAIIDNAQLNLTLERLSGEVRVDSGGIDGLFQFSDSDHRLALGTFVELNLKLAPQADVIELPFNALYGLDNVFLLKEGYLQSIKINRMGEFKTDTGERRLLVRSDELQQGDQIVSTQLPNAMTGLRVEAVSEQ